MNQQDMTVHEHIGEIRKRLIIVVVFFVISMVGGFFLAEPLMKFLHPEIITVDPGYAEAGRQAASQLIEQINGRSEPRQIVIPSTLS